MHWLKVSLDSAIRRAVRRGIVDNAGGVLAVLAKEVDGYDREHLKTQLRAAGGTGTKADATLLLARFMGFARTGSSIATVVESLVRNLLRAKVVVSESGQFRAVRSGGGA